MHRVRDQSGLGPVHGLVEMYTVEVVFGCLVLSGRSRYEAADGAESEKGEEGE